MRKSSDPVWRLLRWLLPYWRQMGLSIVLGVLTIGSSIGLMATSAWMISKAGLQPSIAELGVSVVAVRFFGLARAGLRYLERLVSHDATFRILADIRVSVYRAVEPLAPARLSAFRSGDLLNRAVTDVDTLQNIYLRGLAPPLVALATAALLTTLIAAFDGVVALTALLWFVFSGVLVAGLAWWLGRRAGQTLVRERGAFNAALVDGLQGLPDLIAYGADERQLAGWSSQAERLAEAERRLMHPDALLSALLVVLPVGGLLLVVALAIPRVEGIYLATLALATLAAYEAVVPLAQAALGWGGMREAASRLFELMDTPPLVNDPQVEGAPPRDGAITFENVTFRYEDGQPPVLEGFNLHVHPGERVAIIGESGAGKSTLVNLLVRFWEYEAGSIRLDATEVRNLSGEAARRQLSVMTQQTHLFNTTLRENIRIACPEADDAAVEAAAAAAQIDDFIQSLPQGYDTVVGEHGLKLSGGERQRVALARALLKDAPILILDEATAHLDARTEREVIDALLAGAAGRTVLLFTHNPALLPLLDRVVALPAAAR